MSKGVFYRQCYRETGWLPMQPLTRILALGDVCQIRQGRFQPLLNIGEAHLVENLLVSHAIAMNEIFGTLSQGAYQSSSETLTEQSEAGEHVLRSRQVIEFPCNGDFMFHAKSPSASLLLNWDQIRNDLTLKLTQLHYTFRHAYVVTGVMTSNEWALAVARKNDAKLDMSADIADTNPYLLLSHNTARVEHATGIDCYELSHGETAYFFKAKKLVMSDAMYDRYLNHLIENKDELGQDELANWLRGDLFAQIKANDLNLSSSIGFFNWANMSLDDVDLLSD